MTAMRPRTSRVRFGDRLCLVRYKRIRIDFLRLFIFTVPLFILPGLGCPPEATSIPLLN